MTARTGQCLCTRITYSLSSAAKPFYNTVCHCLNCQKWTGTAFYTAIICPKEGFQLLSGAEYQKTYQDTATDSGSSLRRIFCSECGTNLFALTPLWDGIISVAAGTLDDFHSWKPDTEQWCIHRADWLAKVQAVDEQRTFDKAVTRS
ncbi:Glutathione-dependent formaldehyde-activating family GFA [Lecanosticta acicola]|uniref:Glutathione-dependent formaldehyde-activating family GFA n=1 Tax=Lecanosticta acicola TaxID=111012 RepID=A0AAI8Z8V3_9PEZI|nr:Glutathione-dependent formaldehyde-activating family GFA [Lecanosticta acicola]